MKPLPITRALFTHPTIDPPSERVAGHYTIKTMLRRALYTSWQSWADGLIQSALLFPLSDGHPISLLVLTLSPIATTDYQPISQLPEFLDPNLFDPNPFDPVIALQRSFHGAAADHKNPAQRRVIKEHTPFHRTIAHHHHHGTSTTLLHLRLAGTPAILPRHPRLVQQGNGIAYHPVTADDTVRRRKLRQHQQQSHHADSRAGLQQRPFGCHS